MKDKHLLINGNLLTYIKIPVEIEGDSMVVSLIIPRELQGKYLKIIAVPNDFQDIPVRSRCNASECDNCHVQNCNVHYGNAILYDYEPEAKHSIEKTIPGHPNCHYGDCYNCRVVSCAIQQGWQPIPSEDN